MNLNHQANNTLSRVECSAMRGLAILGIVLHNYCHWLGFAVKENEYQYIQHNVDRLMVELANPSLDLVIHLLSFFGHYGVPVFLFLSAYGLTKKYEIGGAEDKVWSFISKHFVKLFSMMIVGYVAFLMVDFTTRGPHHYQFMDVVAQLGLFNNLLPDPDHIIWPGPYWFFGLMMQLYIVYRLLLYKRHWGITLALMVVCTLVQMCCGPESGELNRLRYNFIGGMLPFGFGLLYARFESETQKPVWRYLVLAVIMLVHLLFLSMNYWCWFFVPVIVCVFAVSLVKILPDDWNNTLAWVGGISSAMFVCHPITRKIFIPISRHGDVWTGLLIYLVASILLALLFKRIMKK